MAKNAAEERANLTAYKSQLEAVSLLLEQDEANEDLLSARSDLQELISLSEESILAAEKARLLAEVNEMVANQEKLEEIEVDQPQSNADDTSSQFIGGLCHLMMRSTRSGRLLRHAVMILDFESGDDAAEDVKVRVLFLHPTQSWMVPCEHFLKQRCTFMGRCKYSHGHLIKLSNVLPYEEPDRSTLTDGGICLALSKPSEDEGKRAEPALWREAEVLKITSEVAVVQFPAEKLGAPEVVTSLSLEDVIPITDDEKIDEDEEFLEIPLPALSSNEPSGNNTIPENPAVPASWEVHTRGIGSKLLAKMGWLGPGTGIGKTDQGRSEPVPVEVMPKGMALDTFLQLRNEGGMVTLGKGAVKMLKTKASQALIKKEQEQNKINERTKHAPSASAEDSFFSFLNSSVKFQPESQPEDGPSSSKKSRPSKVADKDIGVTLLQTAEKIRKLEQEISKMNDALGRLTGGQLSQKTSGSIEVERLQRRISDAKSQLASLRSQEKRAMESRSTERDRRKLTIF